MERVKKKVKESMPMILATTATMAPLETLVAGMNLKTCACARTMSALAIVAGAGGLYNLGKNFFDEALRINEQNKRLKKSIMDSFYGASVFVATSIPTYLALGTYGIKELGTATAFNAIAGLGVGWYLGRGER